MPELPEVEVTRASLAHRLAGARVQSARLGKPLRWPLGVPPESLAGRPVGLLQRRGKYLWLPLGAVGQHERAGTDLGAGGGVDVGADVGAAIVADAGGGATATATDPATDGSGGLLLHLGMSGSLNLADAPGEAGVHDHFELVTSRGVLRLTDPRRFGAVLWSSGLQVDPAAKLLNRLGAEPFDAAMTPLRFHAALHGRRSSLKAALLAGDIVVGAGNIYVSEALHRAGIDPRSRCDQLSRPRAERLLVALRLTLARAIELGGSTLRNFRDGHGMSGAFQNEALVYGREGATCARCGGTVRRIVQAQRATYFCAGCQRR
jgi:formamidopyrimidine-DNA glycosylase